MALLDFSFVHSTFHNPKRHLAAKVVKLNAFKVLYKNVS